MCAGPIAWRSAIPLVSRRRQRLMRKCEVGLHPLPHFIQMIAVLEETAVVIPVLTALELPFEVIVAGRAVLVARGLAAMFDNFLHPPFLGLRRGVDRLITVASRIVDTGRDMIAL